MPPLPPLPPGSSARGPIPPPPPTGPTAATLPPAALEFLKTFGPAIETLGKSIRLNLTPAMLAFNKAVTGLATAAADATVNLVELGKSLGTIGTGGKAGSGATASAAPGGGGVIDVLRDILFAIVALRTDQLNKSGDPGKAGPAGGAKEKEKPKPSEWGDTLKAIISGIGTAVRHPIKTLKKGAKAVGGAAAGGAVAMGAKLAGAVMQPLKTLEAGISMVNEKVAKYVALANPGVLQKWTMATEDLQATIGRSLTPVLDAATTVVREIGGALNAAAPAFEGVFDVFRSAEFKAAVADFGKILAGVLTHVGQAFSALAKALMPLIPVISTVLDVAGGLVAWIADIITDLAPAIGDILKLLVAVIDVLKPIFDIVLDLFKNFIGIQLRLLAGMLQIILPPLTELIKLLSEFTKWVMGLIRQLLEFIGIDFGNETPKAETKSNVGMAARQATFSDPAASLKTAITQAFSIGLGANQTPAETTAKAATGIRGVLSEFFGHFWDNLGKALQKLAGQIARAIKGVPEPLTQKESAVAEDVFAKFQEEHGRAPNITKPEDRKELERITAERIEKGAPPQAEGNPLRHMQDMVKAMQENTKALREKNAAPPPPNIPPIPIGADAMRLIEASRNRNP